MRPHWDVFLWPADSRSVRRVTATATPAATETDAVQERRVRRAAERQGLRIQKCRRRDPRALGFGTYMITDPRSSTIVAGDIDTGYGLTLDEIERELGGPA